MTSDPERLLGPKGDASELERELLGSVRDVAPHGDAKAIAWSGIAAKLAAASVVGAAAAPSAAAAPAASAAVASGTSVAAGATKAGGAGLFASSMLTKLALAVAVTGGAVGGGVYWKQSRDAELDARELSPRTARPATSVNQSEASRVAPPTVLPSEAAANPPETGASEPAPAAPARAQKRRAGTPAEMLAAESALLTEARAALRSGDTEGAARTLDRLRTEFPAGVLVQEREVLAIELLARRGETALARQRAERFIRAHPTSPHSAALRRLLAKP